MLQNKHTYNIGDIVKRRIDSNTDVIGQVVHISPVILRYFTFHCYVGVFDESQLTLIDSNPETHVKPPPAHVLSYFCQATPTGQ